MIRFLLSPTFEHIGAVFAGAVVVIAIIVFFVGGE